MELAPPGTRGVVGELLKGIENIAEFVAGLIFLFFFLGMVTILALLFLFRVDWLGLIIAIMTPLGIAAILISHSRR